MVDWLKISQSSGSGDTQILVEANSNPSYSARTTSLVLSGNTKSINVPVVQECLNINDYLTLEIKSQGWLYWQLYGISDQSYKKYIEYSKNGGPWTNFVNGGIYVNEGDIIRCRGNNSTVGNNCFNGSVRFDVSGNIMSLLNDNVFYMAFSLVTAQTFLYLFAGSNVEDASRLILPATSLTESCYEGMFRSCNRLKHAPMGLPAKTLQRRCYSEMFKGCTALTDAPVFSAVINADSCCYAMFMNCTSLTTAPELQRSGNYSFRDMFNGCTSLTTVQKELGQTDIPLSEYCYERMFKDCTSLKKAPDLPAINLAPYCYHNMFEGCTSLVVPPKLPATSLEPPYLPITGFTASYCYYGMFANCVSLEKAPDLPIESIYNNCYKEMFSGCTNLNYIKCLATNMSSACTNNWVSGVGAPGRFIKKETMNSWNYSDSGIPYGWAVGDA